MSLETIKESAMRGSFRPGETSRQALMKAPSLKLGGTGRRVRSSYACRGRSPKLLDNAERAAAAKAANCRRLRRKSKPKYAVRQKPSE